MRLRYAVVDDAAFIREILKGLMGAEGHLCVGEASDGKEATELTMKTLPDVVFLDLVMPRQNGVAAARAMKDVWPEVKIVACTTLEREAIPDQGAGLMDAWLAKPFTKDDVKEVMKRLFPPTQEKPA